MDFIFFEHISNTIKNYSVIVPDGEKKSIRAAVRTDFTGRADKLQEKGESSRNIRRKEVIICMRI